MIRRSPHLGGGTNEVLEPNLLSIEDGQVQSSKNYYHHDDGSLTLRTEPATYDSNLTSAIQTTYSTALYVISEPFYPPVKPDDMDNDFMLLTYGYTTSGAVYKVHLFFQKSDNSWVKATGAVDHTQGLYDAGIAYTSASDVKFTIADDRIIITDGVNRAHYIHINPDKEFIAGILGISAPTNKATMEEYTEWKQEYWEENVGSDYLTLPGLVQVVYTAVTEDGEESNPSPISQTLDLQYFKKDGDFNNDRWINKILINNLSVPNVSDDIKDELKYFNIYLRTIQYAENEAPSNFYFSQRVTISDKDNTSGSTGNSYSITVSPDLITPLSYENDIAPIAQEAAFTGGIMMLGDVKTQIQFLWEFKYYHKIIVNNVNSQSYVDAAVIIQLDESAIDNFVIEDFTTGATPAAGTLENHQHIRIFDSDLTTPNTVIVHDWSTATNKMDLIVNIPQLRPGENTLYLCFTPAADQASYDGVPVGTYRDFPYGKWHDEENALWANQEVLFSERVLNLDSRVMLPMEYAYKSDTAKNKVNDDDSGSLGGTAEYSGASISMAPYCGELVGVNSIQLKAVGDEIDVTVEESATLAVSADEDYKLTQWFRFSYNGDNLVTAMSILTERLNSNYYLTLTTYDDTGSSGDWVLALTVKEDIIGITDVLNGVVIAHASGVHTYLLGLSQTNVEISVILIDLSDGTYSGEKAAEVNNFMFGRNDRDTLLFGDTPEAFNGIDEMLFDQFQRVHGVYYEYGTAAAENFFKQIVNFLPPFETMIGYDWDATTYNNNVTFPGDSEEIEQKEHKNMLKWSDVNQNSFPDLFYKLVEEPILRIIPAPSFLKFEYGNTFIIFTRNFVHRFVLEGHADEWRASSTSLIKEHKHYGLFDKNTLQRAGSALFWLSEQGVIKWDADGIVNISKNVVDIPFDTADLTYTSMFCHVNDQYFLHTTVLAASTGVGVTYVYDIPKGVWTKFDGLTIASAVALTEGGAKDNLNLIVPSGLRTIRKYPTSTYTTADAHIETPVIKSVKAYLKSILHDIEGDAGKVTVYSDSKSEFYTGPTALDTTSFTANAVTLSASETDFLGGTNANKIINENSTAVHRATKAGVLAVSDIKITIYAKPSSAATYIPIRLTSGDAFNVRVSTLAINNFTGSPIINVSRLADGWLKIEWTIDSWGDGTLQIACASGNIGADWSYPATTAEYMTFHVYTKDTVAASSRIANNTWRRVTKRRGKDFYLKFENIEKLKSYAIEYEERGS